MWSSAAVVVVAPVVLLGARRCSRAFTCAPPAGRGIFYPLLYGTSKGEVVVLTKRMFDDDEMVLGKWMASMGRILL